jgi:ribose transport system permease protein
MMNIKVSQPITRILSAQKAPLAMLLIFVTMLFFKTPFYTSYNLIDLVNSNSTLLIVAMGFTVVLVAGGVDLSVGGVMTVSGIIAIQLINSGMAIPIAVSISIVFGAVIGAINGYLTVYQNTEPFIITLGMGVLLTGVAQQLTTARPISCVNPNFQNLANYKVFGVVPVLVLVMIVTVIVIVWVLRSTSFGRNCYAIGGDYEVAKYSGINVLPTKTLAFVISGVTAALAGVMLSSWVNSGNSTYGDQTALYIASAVVVGGTSFAGGIGGAFKSLLGVIFIGVLSNAFNMLNIDSYIQQLLVGLFIVGIIWLDCYDRKVKREAV